MAEDKVIMTPDEWLTLCTVRIECDVDQAKAVGTGFHYKFELEGKRVPTIITNKHVVEGSTRARIWVHIRGRDGKPDRRNHEHVELLDFHRMCFPHPDPKIDLCMIPFAPIGKALEKEGKLPTYGECGLPMVASAAELAGLQSLEDIVMVGYPIGIWDSVNNQPIVRKGITATHPGIDYCGRPEFLIDAACFPGSSGSPVFLYNMGMYLEKGRGMMMGRGRMKLLGILYAGPQYEAEGELQPVPIPTTQARRAVSRIPVNLGFVIKAQQISGFDDTIIEILRTPPKEPA